MTAKGLVRIVLALCFVVLVAFCLLYFRNSGIAGLVFFLVGVAAIAASWLALDVLPDWARSFVYGLSFAAVAVAPFLIAFVHGDLIFGYLILITGWLALPAAFFLVQGVIMAIARVLNL